MSIASAIFNLPGYQAAMVIMAVMYMGSGVAIPMNHMRETVDFLRSLIISFNGCAPPTMKAYPFIPLDRVYVVFLAAGLLFFGPLGERLFRGRIWRF
jgi:hypothetical protein